MDFENLSDDEGEREPALNRADELGVREESTRVVFMVSTLALQEPGRPAPTEVFMFGSSESLGNNDVPHQMHKITGQDDLWMCSVIMDVPTDNTEIFTTLHYVVYSGETRRHKEDTNERRIKAPIHPWYFHIINGPGEKRLGGMARIRGLEGLTDSALFEHTSGRGGPINITGEEYDRKTRKDKIAAQIFDYLLWDFERGATQRENDHVTPIMTPMALFDSLRCLLDDLQVTNLKAHFLALMDAKKLDTLEIGYAISPKLVEARVPELNHVFTIVAIFGLLNQPVSNRGRNKRHAFHHGVAEEHEQNLVPLIDAASRWFIMRIPLCTPQQLENDIMGDYYKHALNGIRIAAEKVYERYGSFAWFRLLPMLKNCQPMKFTPKSLNSFQRGGVQEKVVRSYSALLKEQLTVNGEGSFLEDWKPFFTNEEGDEEKSTRQAQQEIHLGIVEFCPSVALLGEALKTMAQRVDHFNDNNAVMNFVRSHFLEKHDFKYADETTDFMNLSDLDYLFYGNSAASSANTMAESIMKNDTLSNHHERMIRMLGHVLRDHLPISKTINAMKKWLKNRYASDQSGQEEECVVDRHLLPEILQKALRAWQDMLMLSCWKTYHGNAPEDEWRQNPLLTDLQNRWFFSHVEVPVLLEAILTLEKKPIFPTFKPLLKQINLILVKLLMEAHDEGTTLFPNFIKKIAQGEGLFRHNLCYSLFQKHLGLDEEVIFDDPTQLPLAGILGEDKTIVNVAKWVKPRQKLKPVDKTKLDKFIDSVTKLVQKLGKEVVNKSITLGDLNIIVKPRQGKRRTAHKEMRFLWQNLNDSIGCKDLETVEEELDLFDKELKEFSKYTMMYCLGFDIEVSKLDAFVKKLLAGYDTAPLRSMIGSFAREPAVRHVEWLHSVCESSLFADLWRHTTEAVRERLGRETNNKVITQQVCVAEIIPQTKQLWTELEGRLRTETAGYPEVVKMFGHIDRKGLSDLQVKKEIALLNETTPSKFQGTWIKKMQENVMGLRELERLTKWIPCLINLHEYLKTFLFTDETDKQLDELVAAQKVLCKVDDWKLVDIIPKSAPYLSLLGLATYEKQDFLITLSRKKDLVDFLIREEHKQVNAFKTRLRLVRQCTDDDRLLNGLLQLAEVRTTLDELLYIDTYPNLEAFLHKVEKCDFGEHNLASLKTVIASFDALLDLLDRNTQNPGVKACKEVVHMNKSGKFILRGTANENQQLTCEIKNDEGEVTSTTNFESLVEMRKLLLITDVPKEENGDETLKLSVDEFVLKLKVLEDVRQAVALLHSSGHFAYTDKTVLEESPSRPIEFFKDKLNDYREAHELWKKKVVEMRNKYYFVNYFLVAQLRMIRDDLLDLQQENSKVWENRFEGLATYILGPATDVSKVKNGLMKEAKKLKGNSDPLEQLEQIASVLDTVFGKIKPKVREAKALDAQTGPQKHQQGSLAMVIGSKNDKSIPVYCCTAEERDAPVLDMVLSIFFRVERLLQPEELLICNESTTTEQLELMFRRFLKAADFHREDRIFVIANVQLLQYQTQCAAVEVLRSMLTNESLEKASALVMISSDGSQVLLTSSVTTCRAQFLQMPVIKKDLLRQSMKTYCPNVRAIISDINGGGKTTEIYNDAYLMQEDLKAEKNQRKRRSSMKTEEEVEQRVYHHVSIRENTTSEDFLKQLVRAPKHALVHIDVAHVVPRRVNALLFDLLCIGVVWDPKTMLTFVRRPESRFWVEIPNTPNEIMLESLSLIAFIPTDALTMRSERIRFTLPMLRMDGIVIMEENHKIVNTCRWIRAITSGRFVVTEENKEEFKENWDQDVLLSEPVTKQEAWDILFVRCCDDASEKQPPSFLLFANFSRFMDCQFKRVLDYRLLGMHLAKIFKIDLRHVFCRMLVETTQGFALRQVPKIQLRIENIWDGAYKDLTPRRTSNRNVRHQSGGGLGGLSRGSGSHADLRINRSGSQLEAQISGHIDDLRRGDSAAAQDVAGVGRIKAENYINRFNQMSSWEHQDHPITLFPLDENMCVKGMDLIALNKDYIVGTYMDEAQAKFLEGNQVRLRKDWTKVTTKEAIEVIRKCRGLPTLPDDSPMMLQATMGRTQYVVTIDNLLKTLSILLRLEYGLPVIMMGETGCGKTALVRFIAEALEFPMRVLDVHGGISDAEVIDFIKGCIEDAKQVDQDRYLVAFLDEINAGNVMGVCKSIIVDRMLEGEPIPANVRIVACCNPYRIRKNVEEEQMALVYQHHALDGGVVGATNSMKNLVYRVHQLPESLIDLVSDFGAISNTTEELYIRAILFRELKNEGAVEWFNDFVEIFSRLILRSQEFTRKVNNNERSVVSLRDIARVSRVFHWFVQHWERICEFSKDNEKTTLESTYRASTILTLGYCYHSRLNRAKRTDYFKDLCQVWQKFQSAEETYTGDKINWLQFDKAEVVQKDHDQFQRKFVKDMNLGDGIAFNEALRENLFMLLVSVMNQIPIFVIGKPGCSKSLAVEILQRNLNGAASEKPFLKTLPALQVMAYQCSPLSTANGLLNVFNNARKYAGQESSKTVVCVLLDEVGLAEESPHLPLKVLHKELEQLDGISCIGISNWALDAAKMSRAVTLFRPPPTVDDLRETGSAMVSNHIVKAYLPALSQGFYDIYGSQKRSDFWGLREFYSIVRVINSEFKRQEKNSVDEWSPSLTPDILMNTILRNFGGRTVGETEEIVRKFFTHCSMRPEDATKPSILELIDLNIKETDARHLMLLTQNNSALRLLFDSGIASYENTEVLFGSSFPEDQSDVQIAQNLNKIKSMMVQPMCLVLVQCDSLYESLYDLLNQHYIELAGQRYVRIAHGASSKECPVHHLFRIIVIVEKWDAWNTLAPPLLNRFEKQVFVRSMMVEGAQHSHILRTCNNYFKALVTDYHEGGQAQMKRGHVDEAFLDQAQRVIVGFHNDLISSLVMALDYTDKDGKERDREDIIGDAMRSLIWVMAPEFVTALSTKTGGLHTSKFSSKTHTSWPNLNEEYFHRQTHEDLNQFLEFTRENKKMWVDDHGSQLVVMTHTPIGVNLAEGMKMKDADKIKYITLHEFMSGQDLMVTLDEFYNRSTGEQLIIQADVWASPARQLEFCRYACERKRFDWMKDSNPKDKCPLKFVTMVIHLVRGNSQTVTFEFDKRWRTVFIDAVIHANVLGLPALSEMLHQPLGEVMQRVDLRHVLSTQVLRPALAQLVYPTKRTSDDLAHQISVLLDYIHKQDFLDNMKKILNEIFHKFDEALRREVEKLEQKATKEGKAFHGSQQEWHVIAQTPQRMQRAGTFRAALHSRLLEIMQALVARLFAFFDRNMQFQLYGKGGPAKKLWLEMSFYAVMSSGVKDDMLLCLSVDNPHRLQDVTSDSLQEPFEARFPFSFTIAQRIDELRDEVGREIEDNSYEYADAVIERMEKQWDFAQIPIRPMFADNGLTDADYLHDFVLMRLEKSRIDRDEQLKLLLALTKQSLVIPPTTPLRSFFDIHVSFWLNQKRIFSLNHVLSACPTAFPVVLNEIYQYDRKPDTRLDILVINKIMQVHMERLDQISSKAMSVETELEAWVAESRVVSNAYNSLYSMASHTMKDDPALKEPVDILHETWYPRVMLALTLVRDVLLPLHVDLKIIKQYVSRIPTKVRSLETCNHLLSVFTDIISSPSSSSLPKQEMDDVLQRLGFLLEWFVLNLCLPDEATINSRPREMLSVFVRSCGGYLWTSSGAAQGKTITARSAPAKKEYILAFCELGGHKVPKTESFVLSLMRRLLSKSTMKSDVEKELRELLVRQKKNYDHGDIPLMQYSILVHEHMHSKQQKNEPLSPEEEIVELRLISIENVYNKMELEEKASALSVIRRALAWYANLVRKQYTADDGNSDDSILKEHEKDLMSVVTDWLMDKKNVPTRSMRLFVLKNLNHKGGHTELQNALSREPLATASWVKQWRAQHDTSFDRFIGASVLPKWNPWSDLPSFEEATTQAVSKFINSNGNDISSMNQYAKAMKKGSEAKVGGLLLSIANEAGLTTALPQPTNWIKKMQAWIHSPELDVSPQVKNLFAVFCGDTDHLAGNKYFRTFVLKVGVSSEYIFKYRFLAHLAAAALSATDSNPFRMFATWLLKPDQCRDTFCVIADQDLRETFQKILEEEEGYKITESRFYTCPNGHQYVIGNCGKAFEIGQCPECQEAIGGGGHQPAQGNIRMTRGDNSPTGYTCPGAHDAGDKEIYETRRDLSPATFRCMRLILHGIMYLGVMSSVDPKKGGGKPVSRYAQLFQKTHVTLRGGEDEWFHDQFNADWDYLKQLLGKNMEDTSKLLHDLLTAMMKTSGKEAKAFSLPVFTDIITRNAYETYCEKTFFNDRLTKESGEKRLKELNSMWNSIEGPFMEELAQSVNLESLTAEDRRKAEPLLWCFYQHFDSSVLLQTHRSSDNVQKRCPILSAFLQKDYQKFDSLKELVGIVEFQQLLSQKFSRHITKEEGRKTTFADVLEKLDPRDRPRWKRTFGSYMRAWNSGFKTWIKNWECLELPLEYRLMRMNEDVTLAFLLPSRTDEGICALVLVESITEAHNGFLEVVQRAIGTKLQKKSSIVMDQRDVLNFDIEMLLDYCLESAVSPLPSGGVACDLDKVEHEMLSIFSKKPMVQLEMKMQEFAYQDAEEYDVSTIVMKIPQIPLSREITLQLQKELHDQSVLGELNKCLKTTIGFLSRTLARTLKADDKMLLSEYWKTVLASEDPIPSNTVKAHVQLCHLQALSDIIERTMVDDFTDIMDQYKGTLPLLVENKLEIFAQGLDEHKLVEFLGSLKRYMIKFLRKDDRAQSDCLKIWLGAMQSEHDVDLSEERFYEEQFPEDISHYHAVQTYVYLQRALTEKRQESQGSSTD